MKILDKVQDINIDTPSESHLDLSGLCKSCVQSLALREEKDKPRRNSRSNSRSPSPSPRSSSPAENSLDQNGSSHQKSVLTFAERQEITKYTHGRRRSSVSYSDTNDATSVSKDSINLPNYRNPAKVEVWRKIVKNRLENGESIPDLACHPSFDEILEICQDERTFPAYEPGMDISLEDYQLLQKCKYIRLSNMNLKSMKETAIRMLAK